MIDQLKFDSARICQWGEEIGIPMMGFLDDSPLTDSLDRLETRYQQEGNPPFVRLDPKKRIDYKRFWPKTSGVIVIGIPYSLHTISRDDSDNRGYFASFCQGADYHLRLEEKLELLADRMMDYYGDFEYRLMVDNSALVDREAAWQAGLGFFGKNNLLINPQYGSAFNIGQMLVDRPIEFEKSEMMRSRCGECRRCLNACPHRALGQGHQLDASKCLSYLTQKKNLTSEEEKRISTYLYGCDFCQLVCPFNQVQPDADPAKTVTSAFDGMSMPLSDILKMNETAFHQLFDRSNMAWRGINILKRNAKILIKAQKKDH